MGQVEGNDPLKAWQERSATGEQAVTVPRTHAVLTTKQCGKIAPEPY